MQIQNIDENLSMNISDTSGFSLQVSDVDTSLEMNIATNDVINLNIINEDGSIAMEVETGDSKVEGTTDHSKLKNLDYAHSGHTGFHPKGDYIEDKNYVHTDNNFTDTEKTKLESLNNYDDTLIKKEVSSNTSQINTLKTSVENKAEKTEIPDVSKFITNTVDNLVNYYKKNETFNKSEIEQFSSEIMEQLDDKASKKEIPSLNGYATEEWVEDKDYITMPDFQQIMDTFYYKKEEIDTKLEDLPSGGSELTGGDNTVIEDNKINVYTNTGYIVSDKDIQLQPITETEEGTQEPKLVYTDSEIELIYDGTNKIRRSENGIDFEVIELSNVCKSMIYIPYNKRLIGLYDSGFIYSDDMGKTWEVKESSLVSGNSYLFADRISMSSFLIINKTSKRIIRISESFEQNTSLTSSIAPEFITTLNDTQYIWCNSVGTFKYGAGSKEGNFASISGGVNMLRTVNNKPMIGLKNSNKMYIIKATNQITGNEWVEYELPDVCTINDIIFNPNDETYYIFTDINTYYKTKDLTNPDSFESVDKNGLRGIQGHFTLMGIQLTTSNHNELLLAPTRTTVENMIQLFKRETNKDRWVGAGLERQGKEQIGVKESDTIVTYNGVSVKPGSLDYFYFAPELVKTLKLATAPEKVLSPLEIESWYWENYDGSEEWYYNLMFTEDGSFFDFWTYTEEYIVEKAEKGYLEMDALNMAVTYTSKEKYGALFN